MYMQRKTKYK